MQTSISCNCLQGSRSYHPISPTKLISLTKIKEKVQKRKNREVHETESKKKSLRKQVKHSLSSKKQMQYAGKTHKLIDQEKQAHYCGIHSSDTQRIFFFSKPKIDLKTNRHIAYINFHKNSAKELKLQNNYTCINFNKNYHEENGDSKKLYLKVPAEDELTNFSKQINISTLNSLVLRSGMETSSQRKERDQNTKIVFNRIDREKEVSKPFSTMNQYKSEPNIMLQNRNKSCLLNRESGQNKNRIENMVYKHTESIPDEESDNYSEVIHEQKRLRQNVSSQTAKFSLQKCKSKETIFSKHKDSLSVHSQAQSKIFVQNDDDRLMY